MKLSISHLRAAGVTDSQIVKALEEAEAKIREQNRIRQRNHRARNASNANNSDMRDGRDMRDAAYSFLEVDKKEKIKKVRKGVWGKTTLPEDWQPKGSQRDPTESDEFRDQARAKAWRYADWDAAYRNFQKSSYNVRNKNSHPPPSLRSPAEQKEIDEYQAMMQRLGEEAKANRRQANGAAEQKTAGGTQVWGDTELGERGRDIGQKL